SPGLAPPSTFHSAPISASSFSAPIARPTTESNRESKPELVLQPSAPAPLAPSALSTPPSPTPPLSPTPPSPASFPPPGQRTPEQELASLFEEADKFTTQLAELASGPPKAGQGSAPTEPSVQAVSQAESLLAEAADAIASKPVESARAEQA